MIVTNIFQFKADLITQCHPLNMIKIDSNKLLLATCQTKIYYG